MGFIIELMSMLVVIMNRFVVYVYKYFIYDIFDLKYIILIFFV